MDAGVTAEKDKSLITFFFTFCRDPSDWSAEVMESLGPLLLLDDDAISALPNKVCIFSICIFVIFSEQ